VAPLQQLSYAFLALWAFDNFLSFANLAGVVATHRLSTPFLAGVPTSIYLLWLCKVLLSLIERQPASLQSTRALTKRALSLATVSGTLLLICHATAVDFRGIVAAGGLLGFSISLAVRDTLANIVSCISLSLWRPFAEGDDIVLTVLGLGKLSAKVESVGYVHTTLRDRDNQLIYVPNSALTATSITNATRAADTRIVLEPLLRLSDLPRLSSALSAIVQAIKALPQLDESVAPTAVLEECRPQGIVIKVQALFHKAGPLSRDALRSAAWFAISRAVTESKCEFSMAQE
jgi:small-conductance mechanosensitive channel